MNLRSARSARSGPVGGAAIMFVVFTCATFIAGLLAGTFDLAAHLRFGGTQLDLRATTVTDEDLAQLAGPAFSRVRVVLLARTGVSDAALSQLRHLAVEELDLYRTKVTGAGLVHLEGLPLRRLTLTGTAIDDASLARLQRLPLAILEVGDTALTDEGLRWLRALPLERLDLSRTKVTGKGLADLAAMQRLELLDLSFTELGASGLMELARAPRLGALVLTGARVPDEAVARLRAARPGLRITTDLPVR